MRAIKGRAASLLFLGVSRMDPTHIKEGEAYRTSVAIWTVEHISPSGMIFVRRDDARTAMFTLKSFASWVVERSDA